IGRSFKFSWKLRGYFPFPFLNAMKNKVILETERLYLRPLEVDDFEGLCLLDTDPEVRSYFPEGVLNIDEVRKELNRYISEWETLGFGIFAVVEKKTNQFIGRCGF